MMGVTSGRIIAGTRIGAGLLSVRLFPLIALGIRGRAAKGPRTRNDDDRTDRAGAP